MGEFCLAVSSGRGAMKVLMMSEVNENSVLSVGRVEFGKELVRRGRLMGNLLLRTRFWIVGVIGAGKGEIISVAATKASVFNVFATLQTK